jgi:hypothetical protein
METIVGFVIGYIVGSRDGQDGPERLRESWREIRNSPEARRLAGQAMGLTEQVLRRAVGTGLSGTVSGVSELLARRAEDRTARPAA